MYLKSKWILVLKFKNVLFFLAGLFLTIMAVWDVVSLTVYYSGDWDTIIHARSTPESAVDFMIGCILLICMKISGEALKKAHFYSSYFETALYSNVTYDELSEVTGYKADKVKRDLHIFKKLYMKRFSFVRDNEDEHIELYSKTVECSCKNCGAVIDKKIYFAGICPYCKTSDVFATVITDNQIYSIKKDDSKKKKHTGYYLTKGFWIKFSWHVLAFSVEIVALLILFGFTIYDIARYNDHEYLLNLVLSGEGYGSIELNQKNLMNLILFDIFFEAMFILMTFFSLKKLILMSKAMHFDTTFIHSHKPLLNFSVLRTKKPEVSMRKVIQNGYIRNCTIENQDGEMKIAFEKKIVKDSCPSCGASITGAVDENYVCPFCKNKIIKVIEKK